MKLLLAIAAGGSVAAMLQRNDPLAAVPCTHLPAPLPDPGFIAGLALLRQILP